MAPRARGTLGPELGTLVATPAMAPRVRGTHGAEIGTAFASAPTGGPMLAGTRAREGPLLQPSTASDTAEMNTHEMAGKWPRATTGKSGQSKAKGHPTAHREQTPCTPFPELLESIP
eukprot:3793574-Alexandrium_andersonii.AAC.1